MVCETWKAQLDTYVDGELQEKQMRAFDAHVRACAFCAADALVRIQMKRCVHAAGRRYVPSSEFRQQMQQRIRAKSRRALWRLNWNMATALAMIVVVVGLATAYLAQQHVWEGQRVYSELADLHVATLGSSSPVDVVSTDRHTVKPWFQGRIPFTFDLPELQNSDFSLLGGRVTYLEQRPGAHLIYKIRKHEISVFIFQEGTLPNVPTEQPKAMRELSFNMETWNHGGLRYYVVGDASTVDIRNLSELLKRAAGT
jgi:anti-sigma factor RsiW